MDRRSKLADKRATFSRYRRIDWLPRQLSMTLLRMLLAMLELRGTSKGARLRNVYGWDGWTVEVDIDWRTGLALGVRDFAPPGTRRNARRPTDDTELVSRIRHAAEGRYGWLGFLAAALPTPHRKHSAHERAATIAIMYHAALDQGLSPKRAISAVYGLPVVDVPGRRTQYSRKLERWFENARKAINPATGKPYLSTYDKPKRWPGSVGRHPLEPRRAGPMIDEPKREGPCASRTLTFYYRPMSPPGVNDANHEVADIEIVGRWSDGKSFDHEVEPLSGVTVARVVDHMVRLNSEFEQKYPGVQVRAKFARP